MPRPSLAGSVTLVDHGHHRVGVDRLTVDELEALAELEAPGLRVGLALAEALGQLADDLRLAAWTSRGRSTGRRRCPVTKHGVVGAAVLDLDRVPSDSITIVIEPFGWTFAPAAVAGLAAGAAGAAARRGATSPVWLPRPGLAGAAGGLQAASSRRRPGQGPVCRKARRVRSARCPRNTLLVYLPPPTLMTELPRVRYPLA